MVTHRLLQDEVLADILSAPGLPPAAPGDTVYRLMDDGTVQVEAVASAGALVTVLALPQAQLSIIAKLGEADGALTYDGIGAAPRPWATFGSTITSFPSPPVFTVTGDVIEVA